MHSSDTTVKLVCNHTQFERHTSTAPLVRCGALSPCNARTRRTRARSQALAS